MATFVRGAISTLFVLGLLVLSGIGLGVVGGVAILVASAIAL